MKVSTALFALTTLATGLSAQSEYKYGSFYRSFGNEWVGGVARAYGNLSTYKSTNYERVSNRLLLQADAKFLKRTLQLAKAEMVMSAKKQSGATERVGTFQVHVVGRRIVNRRYTNTASLPSYSRTFKAFPTDPRIAVPIGPFSLTIKGNIGAGLSVGGRMTFDAYRPGVRVDASGSAYGLATATAAFGIPGARVGVDAIGKLANQSLSAGLGANVRYGLSARLRYSLQAISVELKGFVKVLWKKWSKTLVKWSAGSYSRDLFNR